MVGFGESGSGTFSLSACCARQILNGKNATTMSKMKNWQRRKFRLSLGRMKCAATHRLSTAIRIPRIKRYAGTFRKFRRKTFRPRFWRPWCRRSYYRRGISGPWTNFPESQRVRKLPVASPEVRFRPTSMHPTTQAGTLRFLRANAVFPPLAPVG